jgi:LysM repeat protein
MQSLRQIGAGILLSIISVAIVLGGMTLSLTEGNVVSPATMALTPTDNLSTDYPTLQISFTNTPGGGSSATATASLTTLPTPINCPPPAGWLPIVVQPYDKLADLAQTYRTTVDLLRTGNCLLSDELVANSILYVPQQPTATLKPCGAPANWGSYTVLAGDTLYRIGLLYRVSWQELMQANCLGTTYIKAGQVLKVPNVPTSTAPANADTDTPAPTSTDSPVPTITPSPTNLIPTETPITPTETPLPTVAPSDTPLPVDTATPGL